MAALHPDGEHPFEVVPRVHLEGDEGFGGQDALDLEETAGHDVRELLVVAGADDPDQVDASADRVDLGDAVDGGQFVGHRVDAVTLDGQKNECGYHKRTSRGGLTFIGGEGGI